MVFRNVASGNFVACLLCKEAGADLINSLLKIQRNAKTGRPRTSNLTKHLHDSEEHKNKIEQDECAENAEVERKRKAWEDKVRIMLYYRSVNVPNCNESQPLFL